VIATNARKPIFGYRAMIMSIIIGFLRLLCGASYVCFWYESILVQYLLYNTIDAIPSAVKALIL
jgi:heme/copper-type cytochrome/quinol oxidase subunit 1